MYCLQKQIFFLESHIHTVTAYMFLNAAILRSSVCELMSMLLVMLMNSYW